ncbi:MAG TPA: hypothetical protein DEE98_05760 [Elusimicrobia bacterium]|nr:MAG: hypothetical protein A2278_00895 [Elusimicrobia bacterium RIFOXYA12_FULL_49_49]OGS09851.1 MAG: hypothetical protein A2204_05245 [Elusimicrobia bacterium RIFOXYA1_FULL_47_7]OGS11832.1 MAG: hypothetical protein A2386_01000 [Elusimicrobia bacterium RIFOXYB1_FULL_48_9]OGS15054.1 MAG: hypothetical protein A2251_00145 [Elusimicrobia bacterium RIFOXYA2_FULL_47_53]OGS29392.1 MAG: hypothetical protein A2323_00430 [Elusimicrobia bacterium RIFOXYB2_FULL_46_23]HBU69873.1 hypothetical protein [Elus
MVLKEIEAKKKVLVLDDDKTMVDLISDILLEMTVIGDVHGVSDIDHALSLLKSEDYNAILSDIHLNSFDGASGIDFIKKVISLYGNKYNKRIIVLTGDREKVDEALRNGAFIAMVKPFDVEELKEKINNVVVKETK